MTGDPYCNLHGFLPCMCSENIQNTMTPKLVTLIEPTKGHYMEDKKHVDEALAVIKMSPENPFLKDKKKLIKLKLELAKALIEAGHDIT